MASGGEVELSPRAKAIAYLARQGNDPKSLISLFNSVRGNLGLGGQSHELAPLELKIIKGALERNPALWEQVPAKMPGFEQAVQVGPEPAKAREPSGGWISPKRTFNTAQSLEILGLRQGGFRTHEIAARFKVRPPVIRELYSNYGGDPLKKRLGQLESALSHATRHSVPSDLEKMAQERAYLSGILSRRAPKRKS